MAQQTDIKSYYYLNFRHVGAWYIARINDVTFSRSAKAAFKEFILPVNTYLKAGLNTFELIYVPTWGEAYPVGQPNPEFAMRVLLRQLDLQSRAEEEFGLAYLAYDMERGVLVPQSAGKLGRGLPPGQPNFGRVNQITIGEGTYTDIYGPPVEAQVVRAEFTIPSPLPPFPWETGQVMRDSPQLRTELAAAYEAVHRAIASGDFANVYELYEPAWSRMAVSLAYRDAQEYVQVNEPQRTLAPVNKDGATLGDLTFHPDLRDTRLELMAGGRLARFDPDPIFWTMPGAPDQRTAGSSVAFYKDQNGHLKMGTVLLDL